MPEFESLQRALDAVQEDLRAQDRHRETQNVLLDEQNKALVAVQAKLPDFATRWQLALTIFVLALVIALAVVVMAQFRARDRAAVDREASRDRAALIAGCERSNDQRATLREVISRAVVAQPVPPGLDSDLAALFRQGQERAAKLRADLLALPGVQPVDCRAVFPGKDQT